MKKILVGLDGSDCSFKALGEALEMAEKFNSIIETISIEEIPRFSETIGEYAEEKKAEDGVFAKFIHKAKEAAKNHNLKIRSHVIIGHEVKSIIEFVKVNKFDLLVIGFMGTLPFMTELWEAPARAL